MKTKNIIRGRKFSGIALVAFLIISLGFFSYPYQAQALSATGFGTGGIYGTPAPKINIEQPQMNAPIPPPLCPNANQQPSGILFQDDMENGSGNWIYGFNSPPPPPFPVPDHSYVSNWGIITTDVSSPTHALNAPVADFSNDSYAAMNTDVSIPTTTTAYLYFYHLYTFEGFKDATTGYDGGVLEYSTNHGDTWVDAEPLFNTSQDSGQGYNITLISDYWNPLQGRRAFSGSSGGKLGSRYDLSSLAGKSVRFRWRIGSDYVNPAGQLPGWSIDDIKIYACDLYVATSKRVTATPSSLSSLSFTVTFSEAVTGVDVTGPTYNDFSLTTSGVSGAAITNVIGSGTTYNVTVNTGTGNGLIRLDVNATGNIIDSGGSPLTGNFTSGETYGVLKSSIFSDVTGGYWAKTFIERLYISSITGGCGISPLRYCPESPITRDQMAIFLLRSIHGSSYTPPAATGTVFSDVPKTYWAAAWIEQFAKEGITLGCGNGRYCPGASVTRDQMAVFLLRGEHGSTYVPAPANGVFKDVPKNYWAAAWIEQLASEGVTNGCGSAIYCPLGSVTRAQMAVFIVRVTAFNIP